MNKGRWGAIVAVFLSMLLIVACEKADFGKPDPEKPAPTPTPTDTTTIPVDTTKTPTDTTTTDTTQTPTLPDTIGGNVYLSVSLAKEYAERMETDTSFHVEANGVVGYIVGVLTGTTLSSADFTPPFASESNILISDNPIENNVANCMPVQLLNNTQFREELNLATNPNNYGRRIIVEGNITYYFRTYGIKPLTNYTWATDVKVDSTSTDNPKGNPTISSNPTIIEGGR